MREIQLTQGYVALVDDADYEELMRYKWRAQVGTRTVYAVRRQPTVAGVRGSIVLMHRQIKNTREPNVDHWDGNGLNNQRLNLRPCGVSQNGGNARNSKNNTSGFKGVSVFIDRWQSGICVKGKQIHLGHFRDKQAAARAYDTAARKYFGEFARVNFPLEGERAA